MIENMPSDNIGIIAHYMAKRYRKFSTYTKQ